MWIDVREKVSGVVDGRPVLEEDVGDGLGEGGVGRDPHGDGTMLLVEGETLLYRRVLGWRRHELHAKGAAGHEEGEGDKQNASLARKERHGPFPGR